MPPIDDESRRVGNFVKLVLILAVLFVLSQVAGLAAIYWGDEYVRPSWNEHSVPAPRTY
jgi:hypothetical protein